MNLTIHMCVYIEIAQVLQYFVLLDIHHAYCIHLRTEIELKLTMNMCVYCTGIAWILWMCALKYVSVGMCLCVGCACVYTYMLLGTGMCVQYVHPCACVCVCTNILIL